MRFDAKNECISQAQEAAQDKERNESDLYAQRQMAVWAFSVGIAGFISVFLSLAGIFYVWYSLALNRAAVDAAVSANANTLTAIHQDQQNAERQTRAYLTVDSVNSDWDKEFAYRNGFKVKIRNCGQTPAYGIVAGSTVDYRPVGKFSFVSPAQVGAPPVAMLGAGSVMTLDVKELPEITPELQKELLARKMEIAVSGKIEYVDLFNKKRWITFNYAITGNYHHPPSGDVFYPCKIGNEASEPEKKAEHSGSPTSPFPPS